MTRRLISRPAASPATAGRVWQLRATAVVAAAAAAAFAFALAVSISIALFTASRLTHKLPEAERQDVFASVYGKYGLARPDVMSEAAAANIPKLKQRLSDDTPILSHYQSLERPDLSHLSGPWAQKFPAWLPAASIDARVSAAASALAKGNESEAELLVGAFRSIRRPLFRGKGGLQARDIRFAHAVLYVVVGRSWPGTWSFPGSPGEFRTGSASPVAGALSAHALEIEAAVEKLVGGFNSRCMLAPDQSLEAAVCALHFYVNFVRVYPFPDGNRRVGTAVMWAMLAWKGLPPPPPPPPLPKPSADWDGVFGNETKFIEEQTVGILSSVAELKSRPKFCLFDCSWWKYRSARLFLWISAQLSPSAPYCCDSLTCRLWHGRRRCEEVGPWGAEFGGLLVEFTFGDGLLVAFVLLLILETHARYIKWR